MQSYQSIQVRKLRKELADLKRELDSTIGRLSRSFGIKKASKRNVIAGPIYPHVARTISTGPFRLKSVPIKSRSRHQRIFPPIDDLQFPQNVNTNCRHSDADQTSDYCDKSNNSERDFCTGTQLSRRLRLTVERTSRNVTMPRKRGVLDPEKGRERVKEEARQSHDAKSTRLSVNSVPNFTLQLADKEIGGKRISVHDFNVGDAIKQRAKKEHQVWWRPWTCRPSLTGWKKTSL